MYHLHKFSNFIYVWSDHSFRLWVNKNMPTWVVVRMTGCCNSVLLYILVRFLLAQCTFPSTASNRAGQRQELIHPVQNHLTLVSLVSIFWHIFWHFEWIYKYKRNPSSQLELARISFIHVLRFRLRRVRWLDRPCAVLLIHTDSLIFSNRTSFPDASFLTKLSFLPITPIGTTALTKRHKGAKRQTTTSSHQKRKNKKDLKWLIWENCPENAWNILRCKCWSIVWKGGGGGGGSILRLKRCKGIHTSGEFSPRGLLKFTSAITQIKANSLK